MHLRIQSELDSPAQAETLWARTEAGVIVTVANDHRVFRVSATQFFSNQLVSYLSRAPNQLQPWLHLSEFQRRLCSTRIALRIVRLRSRKRLSDPFATIGF